MPTKTDSTQLASELRAQLIAIRERVRHGVPAPATPVLLRVAFALYEFNRSAAVSALRSTEAATDIELTADILENLRLFLESSFESSVSEEQLIEMSLTSSEVCFDLANSTA